MTTIFQDTDLNVYRGQSETHTFSIYQSGVGINVQGQTIYCQARSIPDSMFPIFDTRSTSGMAITDGVNGSSYGVGKIVLKLTDEITKILPTHSRYDIKATDGSDTTVLASGNIILKKDVSR